MPPKYNRKPRPDLTEALLELIKLGATNRLRICVDLEICQDTLRSRLSDHLWKAWQIDKLCSIYKIKLPDIE